ncbi:probable VPS74-protein involved in protein-vacuolar targeting [Ustilago bromivora]|uniref:Probable VPS74 - protein involved in protein-vacuolar targeting n=1 Tax=Ustilago bromivora TaxID=307758 RepID=A0A1K0G597_9BASI|nr:probable VPS74-protein involved in protein-vacuolar targeting [Ustilago bromivora]SPC64245.1 probable VPS74 - protein involved in protein-vacuolar targeting [Ustilago sp. UG-2017b]SYW82337.1 probable VPS74 - protein involved in protein-vacuolar targeting [Ustilago bromivora]
MASTQGGLQRRRGAGAANSSAEPSTSAARIDDDDFASRTASPANAGASTPTSSRNPAGIAASAYGSRSATGSVTTYDESTGHRVAYDPRDLNDEKEIVENPRLTLMEEILLLGLKDRQGYLSFWNDNISYTLRGCILIELALRRRIAITKDPMRKRFGLTERVIDVIDGKMTGEVLLDEALKMMKASDRMSVGQWVDLMSGETWNVMKIGYQLKQVRERLAKGLVDKGILRTEKRNFLLFDMATHPLNDSSVKDAVLRRVLALLTSTSPTVHANTFYKEDSWSSGRPVALRVTRALCLLCCSFSANVLENALNHLSYEARESAFQKADDILEEFANWPMAPSSGLASGGVGGGSGAVFGTPGVPTSISSNGPKGKANGGARIGEGSMIKERSYDEGNVGASVPELAKALQKELEQEGDAFMFECIAAVLSVLSRMDSLL